MAVTFNGTSLNSIIFNNTTLNTVTFNDTTVYTANASVDILKTKSMQSGVSVAPPPYNDEGYNVNESPQEKRTLYSIPSGLDPNTRYDKIIFQWDNNGSVNSYGEISAYVVINGIRRDIFSEIDKSGKCEIDISSIATPSTIDFFVVARSLSAYRGYISNSVLNVYNLMAHAGGSEPGPAPLSGFTLDSGISVAPPPYDDNGYNYNTPASEVTNTKSITIDATGKSSLTLVWHIDNSSNNNYGIINGAWGINNSLNNLFRDTYQDYHYEDDHTITVPISSYSGNITLDFEVTAQSVSPYRGWNSRSVLRVDSITIV
ncbi:MAG: hypothetical protein J6U54_01665 [Clostridiales bacterium]|nr:hypothetical protein [Clostridiales bacterium]